MGARNSNWNGNGEREIRINLIERSTGKLATSRILYLKQMNIIKEKLKYQNAFNKEVIDTCIRKAISKSLDEMVYNGFILEVVKGDRNMKERYLQFN